MPYAHSANPRPSRLLSGIPGYARWLPGLILTVVYYYIGSIPTPELKKQIPIFPAAPRGRLQRAPRTRLLSLLWRYLYRGPSQWPARDRHSFRAAAPLASVDREPLDCPAHYYL